MFYLMSKFMVIDSNTDNCSVYIAALTKLIQEWIYILVGKHVHKVMNLLIVSHQIRNQTGDKLSAPF